MATEDILDHRGPWVALDVGHCLREVRNKHGKAITAQLGEIARLALGEGRLTPKEYFYYGLYDDSRFTFADKKKFIGRTAQRTINGLVNTPDSHVLANDKVAADEILRSHGLPIAETIAVYNGAAGTSQSSLSGRAELKAFLRAAPYPLFGKPVSGLQSRGSARLEGCSDTELTMFPGTQVALDAFIDEIEMWPDGYLFQQVMRPHPAVGRLCGDKIASLRLMVTLGRSEPALLRPFWKIPAGDNIADSFWRTGNLVAPVELATGRVGPATRGAGLEREVLERHPDTGSQITGMTIPHWDDAKRLCLETATLFPDMKLQGWDIAICEKRPVLQEINAQSGFHVTQLANGAGLLDDQFRAFLSDCAPSWRSATTRAILQRTGQVIAHIAGRKLRVLRRTAS